MFSVWKLMSLFQYRTVGFEMHQGLIETSSSLFTAVHRKLKTVPGCRINFKGDDSNYYNEMKMKKKWKVESEFNRVSNTNLPTSFSFLRDHLSPPPLIPLCYIHVLVCTTHSIWKKFLHVLLSFIALSPKPLGQVCV